MRLFNWQYAFLTSHWSGAAAPGCLFFDTP
jgi:hypothetical protein